MKQVGFDGLIDLHSLCMVYGTSLFRSLTGLARSSRYGVKSVKFKKFEQVSRSVGGLV